MASASTYNFTLKDAKEALNAILEAFKLQENVVRLDEARDNAGNDMLRFMQIVFPVATKIQMDIIQKYGFSGDGDGLIHFAQAIRIYEKDDEEIEALNRKLRSSLIPQMDNPPLPLPLVASSPSKQLPLKTS